MLEDKLEDVLGQQTLLRMSADASVTSAAKVMADNHIGAMLVSEGEEVSGIFTERDLLERVVAPGLPAYSTPLRNVMTRNPVSVSPHDTLLTAVISMRQQRTRHLLVKRASEVVGILSVRDVLRSVVDTMLEDKERLEHLWQGFPV